MARLLLLDDEARLLRTLTRFLEASGHEVRTGLSFAAIEKHVRPNAFDVLISDILMPGQSGMDVLREVMDRGCQEPVVLITGEPRVETASEAVRLGAFDYVPKPITKDKILEVVTRALRHVDLVRERDRARDAEMQLLRRFAEIGKSASMLAHEIKAPITSLNQALCAVGDKLNIEHRQVIDGLSDRLLRIRSLMQRTLDFARPLSLDRQPASIGALLAEVRQQYHRVAGREEFVLDVALPDGDLIIHADPGLLEEVLCNLVQNAGEACDFVGRVALSAVRGGQGSVTLHIEDDGPGIPAERRENLFRLFQTTKKLGSGLGLAICRKIITAHEGTLRLVDGRLPGACFEVRLPAAIVENPETEREMQA